VRDICPCILGVAFLAVLVESIGLFQKVSTKTYTKEGVSLHLSDASVFGNLRLRLYKIGIFMHY